MLPLIVLGIVGASALLLSGCGDSKDDKKDAAAPPPPPKPKSSSFEKEKSYSMVGEQAYDTAHLISDGNVSKLNMSNWHIDARMCLAADYQLFKTTRDDPSISGGNVSVLKKAMTECFGEHYKTMADPKENGFRALVHCLGVGTISEDDFVGANQRMSHHDKTQVDWMLVKQACYYFDKATAKASSRFSKPNGYRMSASERATAKTELAKARELIEPYRKMMDECHKKGKCAKLNGKLNDFQQKILFNLIGFIDAYGSTLGKIGGGGVGGNTGNVGGSGGGTGSVGNTGGTGGKTGSYTIPDPF